VEHFWCGATLISTQEANFQQSAILVFFRSRNLFLLDEVYEKNVELISMF